MNNKIKTFQEWDNEPLNGNLQTYLGDIPCEVDEELFLYILDVTSAKYASQDFIQGGDPQFQKYGVEFYLTCSNFEGRYFYLGILPEFKQE